MSVGGHLHEECAQGGVSEGVDDEYVCERSGIQPSVSGRIGYRQ